MGHNRVVDRNIYDAIFGDTFKDMAARGYDLRGLADRMLTTAQVAIGGNTAQQIPAYWKYYAIEMQNQNKKYLEGLVKSAQGQSSDYKRNKDVAEVAGKVVKHGIAKGAQTVVSDALKVDGMSQMIVEKIIDITISLIQPHMLSNSAGRSRQFSDEERAKNMDAFGKRILFSHGGCGRNIPSSEADRSYANGPHYAGHYV